MTQCLNLEQIAETNVFEMRKLKKKIIIKVTNPKIIIYVQKLFMGFEKQQLAGKAENNMMAVERDG